MSGRQAKRRRRAQGPALAAEREPLDICQCHVHRGPHIRDDRCRRAEVVWQNVAKLLARKS